MCVFGEEQRYEPDVHVVLQTSKQKAMKLLALLITLTYVLVL